MMQLRLDEISRNVAEGAHAVLILDRTGWHTTGKLDVPDNIAPIFLPSRAPELNPVENVWQCLRQNWVSNTVFENYDAIVDAHAPLGESSSLNPKPSPPSECATALTSVSRYDPWDKCAFRAYRWLITQAFRGRSFGGVSSRTATPLRSGEGGG
jgi:hypothetical protein